MKSNIFVLLATSAAITFGQSPSRAILMNFDSAKWAHDADDPPGLESVFLQEDAKTGGIEMLVKFPAGHVIAPHWHDSNERLIVLGGQLTLHAGDAMEKKLERGAFAFLPATEVQRLSCSSKEPCIVYLAWDGKPNSHTAK